MREIKFKLFNRYNYSVEKVVWMKNDIFGKLKEINTGFTTHIINGDEEKFELLQYTGLKDCEGNEIYEGDIVEVYWGNDKDIGEVEWFSSGFYVKKMKRHAPEILGSFKIRVKVIGDIYENQEGE